MTESVNDSALPYGFLSASSVASSSTIACCPEKLGHSTRFLPRNSLRSADTLGFFYFSKVCCWLRASQQCNDVIAKLVRTSRSPRRFKA